MNSRELDVQDVEDGAIIQRPYRNSTVVTVVEYKTGPDDKLVEEIVHDEWISDPDLRPEDERQS
jgi:hypothetical protein